MSDPTIEQVQRDLLRRIKTEGVQIAYETALAVCQDPKSTSPARATASATLFRVAGYFDRGTTDTTTKDPHEMTPEEISAEIGRIRQSVDAKNPGVFD